MNLAEAVKIVQKMSPLDLREELGDEVRYHNEWLEGVKKEIEAAKAELQQLKDVIVQKRAGQSTRLTTLNKEYETKRAELEADYRRRIENMENEVQQRSIVEMNRLKKVLGAYKKFHTEEMDRLQTEYTEQEDLLNRVKCQLQQVRRLLDNVG